ncbi:iron chelate uptake ABC transporter family permease subunit [Haloechinothrix sp. LS1_15]|uniref:FecCD family ABC transporter permease n=1 Tax=Haloechinothrix sp. LS1_15 TaxID=2652248 RepID=UPI00294600FC|nr:iron chelate uptake ABC transporter family permease subunit [Haloechinothrix sp. LS1_15]MDV6013556.1 iron chelate uptake ABC transporter family permease subunit [Haloechinothrix sp. LS1_15]
MSTTSTSATADSGSRAGAAPSAAGLLPAGTWVVRIERFGFSARVYRQALVLGCVLCGLTLAATAVSLTLGDFSMSVTDVLAVVAGEASPMLTHVVVDMRLPRVLTGIGVGAALAVSGMILQRLAHNPLVSPDIIGINAGASAAAVATIVLFAGTTLQVAGGALTGAVVTAMLLYMMAYRRGVAGYRLVLIGIGLTAMLSSVTSYLLTRTDIDSAERAMIWLTGSLANRSWSHAATIWLALAVLVPVTLALTRQLRLLQLGDDTAAALGGRVQSARAALLFTSAATAAFATAVAGPVAFVALVAPQIVRRLLRERVVGMLPAMACGALLVISSDLLARTAFGPSELPVGVITGVLGAPYLLYLLTRMNRIGHG